MEEADGLQSMGSQRVRHNLVTEQQQYTCVDLEWDRHGLIPPAVADPSLGSSRVHVYFHCCCSVIKSCLTLCDSMDCSLPGFPALYICIHIYVYKTCLFSCSYQFCNCLEFWIVSLQQMNMLVLLFYFTCNTGLAFCSEMFEFYLQWTSYALLRVNRIWTRPMDIWSATGTALLIIWCIWWWWQP